MISVDREVLIDTIAALVRIPSINPTLVPGATGEADIAQWIADRLRKSPGIDVELQDAGDGRPNVIASAGQGPGRILMINGHIDTVGVAGMPDPFSGHVVGNRLYGRGSDDMKASMAGAILLLEHVARDREFPGRIVVTFVVDEEHSSIGTEAICRDIARWQPDAAIVVEPSGLTVTTAHKGFAWATITTHGFAAHGSDFRSGRDAIASMGYLIAEFDAYCQELVTRPPHPVVGPPSAHCSLIRGGQELSSYPEMCHLDIERRMIPGESADLVRQELHDVLERARQRHPVVRASLEMGLVRQPFEIDRDAEIVTCLAAAFQEELGHEPVYHGAAGWMDSALLSTAGVPCVIFGPVGAGGHGLEEWTDLDTVDQFIRVLARTAYQFCGGGVADRR